MIRVGSGICRDNNTSQQAIIFAYHISFTRKIKFIKKKVKYQIRWEIFNFWKNKNFEDNKN